MDERQNYINYTVKELLGEVRNDISKIDQKLDNKASEADVRALSVRVAHLESFRSAATGTSDFKKFAIPILAVAMVGLPGWLLALSQLLT